MKKNASPGEKKMPPEGLLSAVDLNSLPIPNRPRKMGDGGGLYLELQPNGARYWRLKYRVNGRENRLSLGGFPAVSLAEARCHAQTLRDQLAEGVDPSTARKDAKAQAREAAPTEFLMSSSGALVISLPRRRITLNPAETARLRTFLVATTSLGDSEHGN